MAAETVTVIGLVSAIVQFIDFGNRVVGRLNEYRQSVNEVPKTYRKINRQLPLLIDTLKRTQNLADAGHVGKETARALKPVVEGCLAHVKQLEDILIKALPSEKDSTWSRRIKALASLAHDKTIQQITSELDSDVGMLAYHQATSSSDFVKVEQDINSNTDHETKDYQCLCGLRLTDPRDDRVRIEKTKDNLLEDSYKWILDDPAFRNWRSNDDSLLLWIKGDPGKGKTMLMIGIIEELSRQLESEPGSGILSFFFCQGTDLRLNNAVSVLRGLIYLLVDQQKNLIRYLRKRYDTSGQRLFEDANAFYALSSILLDMLQDSSLAKVYLMVDALDECDSELSQLLDLIACNSSKLSRVKWLVSSRNRPDIEERLRPNSLRVKISLELNAYHISRAVNAFIDFKVSKLAERKGYKGELREKIRSYLYAKADGTFLWVALVCKGLESAQVRSTLAVLETFPLRLQPLYERMMEHIWCLENSEDVEFCTQILSSVTLAFRPLQLKELVATAGLQERPDDLQALNELVDLCGSFLTVREEIVYFVHQSAKDYFSTSKGSQIFRLSQAEEHGKIACRSLQVMSDTLKRDICGIQVPGALVGDKRSVNQDPLENIQYACCYWVDHLQQASYFQQDHIVLSDNGQVHVFLQEHFLHWLEALSLIRNMSNAIVMVRTLESMLKYNTAPLLLAIIQDAKRFILYNRSIIERAPLQVYASALVFSPKTSLIRRQFSTQGPRWIESWPDVEENWNSTLQTLDGHSDWVNSVVFSPDGRWLASASDDGTVRLWDAKTGALQQTLDGHSDWVNSVVFSPDGRWLASASADETVRLWDAKTGVLQQMLKGHSYPNYAVTFSPNGRQLASASAGKTVLLWDAETGALQQTLDGHSDSVNAISFSPNGQWLASASDDKIVQLWDAKTGALQKTLKGHSNSVRSIAFSPNGQQLASGSRDDTVRLWDTKTMALQQTLKGHTGWVYAVTFSPNGQRLASASADETVRLWDAKTGALKQTFKGHSNSVRSIAFSPDGQRLASASRDKTVRLWDVETGVLQQTLKGQSNSVRAVIFSPDERRLASASDDKIVRLWDAKTGALQQTLNGHSGWVISITFSPDGRRLASASRDKTVRLWDVEIGTLQQTLKGHSNSVNAITFSPNGERLASASDDKTVRLWDAKTGALQQTLKGHFYVVRAVTFSPDGRRLASASDDKTVQLWDAETGAPQQTLKGHSSWVRAIKFSPNGQQLVSAADDKTVRLWDAKTGALQQTLDGHSSWVRAVAFSPDGQRIITDLGSINLGTPQSSTIQTMTWSSYSLDKDRYWIMWEGHSVLWLPAEYRPRCQIFQDNVLAMGHSSGRVSIIRFKQDVSPITSGL